MDKVLFASGRDDWETPDSLIEAIRRDFLNGDAFDLDPCTTFDKKKGIQWFGPDNAVYPDGLAQDWGIFGSELKRRITTAFVNPPFGKEHDPTVLNAWIRKCCAEVDAGHVRLVVALLPVRTDRKVWHECVFGKATEIRFLKGRVRFLADGKLRTSATFPSAVVVWERGRLGRFAGGWDWRKEMTE